MPNQDAIQQIHRELTKAIDKQRYDGDPFGLVKGLLQARSIVRQHIPHQYREVKPITRVRVRP